MTVRKLKIILVIYLEVTLAMVDADDVERDKILLVLLVCSPASARYW
jgi:hypothetical protein